ncbi:MAG: hypothetical protein M1831_005304 [Alyxoria varia]|nr:MAG: hypothetical protein M1831_005304 [Alyxoria varia]
MLGDVNNQNRDAELYGSSITLLVLATVAVIVRFIARRISHNDLWWDDWTILAAFVFYVGLLTTYICQSKYGGLGRHTVAVGGAINEEQEVIFFKIFMAVQVMYAVTCVTVKTSLILLYYRLFSVARWFRHLLVAAECIVVAFFISAILVGVLECDPVAYYWDKSIEGGTCINQTQFYRWNGIANMLIDLMILSITVPMVWRLNISMRRKAMLSGIFLLGTFVFVASIVRITTFEQFEPADITYTDVPAAIWTLAEQSLAIVCSCLICLRPLLRRTLNASRGGGSGGGRGMRSGGGGGGGGGGDGDHVSGGVYGMPGMMSGKGMGSSANATTTASSSSNGGVGVGGRNIRLGDFKAKSPRGNRQNDVEADMAGFARLGEGGSADDFAATGALGGGENTTDVEAMGYYGVADGGQERLKGEDSGGPEAIRRHQSVEVFCEEMSR